MAAVTLLQKWQLLQVIFADAKLSATAKLVAGRLLFHHRVQTGRCCPSYQTLADGVALKRRAVINAIQELETGSWIELDRVKGGAAAGANRYATNEIRIDFSRLEQNGPTVHADAPSTVHGGAPSTVLADALLPDDNSAPPCTGGVHGGAPLTVHGGAPDSGKDTGKGNREVYIDDPLRFDDWWDAYPRKVGKDEARRTYLRILRARKATVDELIAGSRRYATERAGESPTFTKHPKTWLNGGCWADEPAPSRDSPAARSPQRGGFSATRDWLPGKVEADG